MYQLLFDNYQISNELHVDQGGLGMPPVSALLRRIINSVDLEMARRQKPLRPDGKYFLLINFYSMIYTPLSIGGGPTFEELIEAITSDVGYIVQNAAPEPGEEISAHLLLNFIATRWRDLKTTRFRLWGDE